jgi:tRNA dimethylallyltransferase
VVLVSGPTASGKSGLAVYLAQRLDGEVINIDSVQVYSGARIGAATITEQEMQGVPHHLIGFLDPAAPWDVKKMSDVVGRTATEIRSRGKVPVLVGGGGLYVSALFGGISPLPDRDPALRAALEARDDVSLYEELVERDADRAAQLHPRDRLRVIRALETVIHRGTASAVLFADTIPPWVSGFMIVLSPPREVLYQAINTRVEAMIRGGLVEEVTHLFGTVPADSVLWRAIGYAHGRKLLEGQYVPGEFESEMQRDTRRFAKRQFTYWRNEPQKRGWSELEEPLDWTWLVDRGRIEFLCEQNQGTVARVPFMGSDLVAMLSHLSGGYP